MAGIADIAKAVVTALNARDFTALAEKADEDIAIAGIGEGMDNGRAALRERLARHFQALDETYGDAQVMTDETGGAAAVRLTARGRTSAGAAYSKEKILLLEIEDGRMSRIAFFSADGT